MDIRIVGASLGAVALLAGGYFLAVAPQNASTAETREEAETITAESERTLATIPGLRAQLADIAPEVDYLRQLSTQVPPQINLPDLYAELDAAAAAAGIPSAENVTVSTPVLVTPETADLPAPAEGEAPVEAPVDDGALAEEGATAPAAPAATAAVIARYDVSLTVMGNPEQISAFLGALDNSGRMNTITSTNITSGEDGRATIQAVFYLQQVDVDGIAQQIEDLVAVEAGQTPGESEEAPADEAPVEEAPAEEAPIEDAPVGDLPAPTE